MAESNPQVMEMIEAELRKNPDISNQELLEKAKKIDPGVADLSARQFNATYPLQVKRALKPPKPRKRKSSKRAGRGRTGGASSRSRRGAGSGDGREEVRAVLLELARDIASAEGKGEVVDVIAGIDRYVDRVVKAGG